MGESLEFEEWLATLNDEPEIPPQHNAGSHSAVASNQHPDLSQIHVSSSLGVLDDDIQFHLQDHSNLGLPTASHLGSHIPNNADAGSHGIPGNMEILGSTLIEDAFSQQIEQADSNSMQTGSSLGSLFLHSVDELLSNEKTQFPPPQVQAPQSSAKSPKAKSNKLVQQRKVEKLPQQSIGSAVAMDSSPQLGGNQQYLHQQSGSVNGGRNQVLPGTASATGGHVYIGRQQNVQLSRPHSNASEASLYPGSVPQPSPAGSVDSSINPRTPLSNNPLTPQSLRPPTPQTNLSHGSQNARSSSATPHSQIHQQQMAMMQEPEFMSVNPSQMLSLPDDQSHLQYLNTPSSNLRPNASQLSGLKTSIGFQPQSHFMPGQERLPLPQDISSYARYQQAPPSASQKLSEANWQQSTLMSSNLITSQAQSADILNFKNQSNASDMLSDMPQNITATAVVSNFNSSMHSFANVPGVATANFESSRLDPNKYDGSAEGLTYNQCQILDNLSEWSKPKTKADEVRKPDSKQTDTRPVINQQPPPLPSHPPLTQSKHAAKSNYAVDSSVMNFGPTSASSVEKSLHAAESEMKQVFSHSIAYEAVSPVSVDNSPLTKEPTQSKSREAVFTDITSISRQQTSSPPKASGSPRVSSLSLQSRPGEEKKTGPLARRRSASKEKKSASVVLKKPDSGEFNFEDEFGLDPNEPTIRLPTKRNDAEPAKSSAVEVPNPIMVQTMQRESYTDPSLYDSVQELAVLQQKQKSLMEALNASRSAKATRTVQKPANTVTPSKAAYQTTAARTTSTVTTHKPRARKPSKTNLGKDVSSRSSASMETPVKSQTQSEKIAAPATIDNAKADDLFYQQFFNNASTKSNISSLHPSPLPPSTQKNSAAPSQIPSNMTIRESRQSVAHTVSQAAAPQLPAHSLPFADGGVRNKQDHIGGFPLPTNFPPSTINNPVPSIPRVTSDSYIHSTQLNAVTQSTTRLKSSSSGKQQSVSSSFSTSNVVSEQSRPAQYQPPIDVDAFSFINPVSHASQSKKPFFANTSAGLWEAGKRPALSSSASSSSGKSAIPLASSEPNVTGIGDSKVHDQRNADVLNSFLTQRSAKTSFSSASSSTSISDPKRTANTRPIPASSHVSQQQRLADFSSLQFDALAHEASLSTAPTSLISRAPTTTISTVPVKARSPALAAVTSTAQSSSTLVNSAFSKSSPAFKHTHAPDMLNVFHPISSDPSSTFANPWARHMLESVNKHMPGGISLDAPDVQQSLELMRLKQQQFEKQFVAGQFPSSSTPHFGSSGTPSISSTPAIGIQDLSHTIKPPNVSTPSNVKSAPDGHRTRAPPFSSASSATHAAAPRKISADKQFLSTPSTKVSSASHSNQMEVSNKAAASLPSPAVSSASTALPKAAEQSLPSTVNILKDKTYHGPKKKHILEKYSQQTQKPNAQRSAAATAAPPNSTKLDYTSNKSHLPGQSGLRLPTGKQSASSPAAGGAVKVASDPTRSSSSAAGNKRDSGEAVNGAQRTDGKSSKNEQSGSIFSIFDSLLQEATEHAEGSLKNEPPKKKTEAEKTSKDVLETSKTEPKKKELPEKRKQNSGEGPKKAGAKSTAPITTATTSVTVSQSVVLAPVSVSTAVSRSPATLPFKRRHAQIQSKTAATVSTAEAVSTAATTATTRAPKRTTAASRKTTTPAAASPKAKTTIPAAGSAKAKMSSSVATTAKTKTVASAAVSVRAKTSVSVAASVKTRTTASSSSAHVKPPTSSVQVVQSKPGSSPHLGDSQSIASKFSAPATDNTVGLKLRITAFRSASGQVIHQSTLLGDLVGAEHEPSRSDRSYHRKKKRKKRKKQLRELEEISRCLFPIIPVNTKPNTDVDRDRTFDSTHSYSSDDPTDSENQRPSKRQRKGAKKRLLPSLVTSSHCESSTGVDSEPEKLKAKQSRKKAPKVVQRYGLKANTLACSSDGDPSSSRTRPAGKPPLYITAVMPTSLGSGSENHPTIQLVPRSISKLTALSSASAAKQSIAKSTPGVIRYILPTANPLVASNLSSSRVAAAKITPLTTFSVGKATVFTVSSSGARVFDTPKIQIQPTPSQTSSVNLTGKSIMVKRATVVSKPATSSVLSAKVVEASSAATSLPCVVSFTSMPVKVSSKIIAPKPVLATSKSSPLKKMINEICSPQIVIPTVAGSTEHVDDPQGKGEEFHSAFSKLISTPNPLNKYVPPIIPTEYLSLMDEDSLANQQCYECGDSFLFNKSLMHHYERRSILVKVRCVQCSQMLVFFNKCEILRHAREHSEHGDVMQFNGAILLPLPLSLCRKRSKEDFLAAASEAMKLPVGEGRRTTECAMACTECSYVTDGRETLEDHFQKRDCELRLCDICKLPSHNRCASSAHMRIHRHAAPHTCPECGQSFDGNKMDFNLHLRIQCFHLSRTSCYKCKLCNLTFLTDDQLRHHLRQNHVQMFYKCRECPMAFKTTQNIANHQRSAHNLTPEPTNMLKTLFKCPLCESVFSDSNHSQQLFVLHKHFDGHIKSARITAYKCYLCTRLFEQKAPLRDHLQQDHDISALDEMNCADEVVTECSQAKQVHQSGSSEADVRSSKLDRLKKKLVIEVANSHSLTSQSGPRSSRKRRAEGFAEVTTSPSQPNKSSRPPFKMRIKGLIRSSEKTSHTMSSSSSSIDSPSPPSTKPARTKLAAVLNLKGKKTYPCPECEKVFYSSHSRSGHVRSVHRGIRALYCCTHCPVGTVKFAKRITLVKHLSKVHGIKNPQKDEIKIIRTHVPFIPGEKFKAAMVNVDKHGKVVSEKAVPEKKMARKKFTSGQARARRLAVAAGKRMRSSVKEGLTHSDSEESYGEVDERIVEEGWQVEDEPTPKSEAEDIEVDASFFNFPEVYICTKCDFQHCDRMTFQDHITEHSQVMEPQDSSSVSAALTMVQCTECGLCFASGTSLDKHMHIKHKIKRRALLERYDAKLREERRNMAASGVNASANSGPISNFLRCKVCFRKFDDETGLKTHMRTHGLAFVKSKHH